MAKYLIEGSCDGSLFCEAIEAKSQTEAEALAIQRLCEAWGEEYGPDTILDDLGDCAEVTKYTAEDYARDAAPVMLAALQWLRDEYCEGGAFDGSEAEQRILIAIAAATGQPIEETDCATCADATETRLLPCDECGETDEQPSEGITCPADGNLLSEDGICGFCGNAPEAFTCTACGREESECSAEPCAAVIADRED